jgi:hypothetical protein
MKNTLLIMAFALIIIGCGGGGGGGFSGGLPTMLNDNATATNDNATLIVDNNNTVVIVANEAPVLEDYIEYYIDNNKVTLFWKEATDSDGKVEGYFVSYRLIDGEWSGEYYNDRANYAFILEENQIYQFRIKAVDDGGAFSGYIYSERVILPIGSTPKGTKTYCQATHSSVTLYLVNTQKEIETSMQLGVRVQGGVDWIDRDRALLVSCSRAKIDNFQAKRNFTLLLDETKEARSGLQEVIDDVAKVTGQNAFRLIDERSNETVYEFTIEQSKEMIEILFLF